MTRLPQLLFGRGVFAPVHHILEELPFERMGERPSSLPHSIFEELWHLDFWQSYFLAQAHGKEPHDPGEGGDWPQRPSPTDTGEWSSLLESIRLGLDEAAAIAADAEVLDRSLNERTTVRSVVESIVAHNSYHLGRVVALRQALGIWPPQGSR
jgi:uncharacterized damage-inducible protein DinB